MKSYCLKCRKDTENINPKVSVKQWYYQNVQYAVIKNQDLFIKNQEAKGQLSNLGLRTPLIKVTILGDIWFWVQFIWMQFHWVQFHWSIKWVK